MHDTVIRNGIIVNADSTQRADVAIDGERIVQIGGDIGPARVEIDARGALVMPGGVDVHTHLDLDLPDFQTADDFATGSRAAICGGTTTIVDFCQQRHGQSLKEALEIWHGKAGGKAAVDYGFHMVVTDLRPEVERELAALPAEGITSFKLFMAYKDAQMVDDRTMLRVLEIARDEGALVMVHAENGDAADYLMARHVARGETAPRFHASSRPPRVESEAVGRAVALAELVGAPVYIVHLTCAEALAAVLAGRARGVRALAETCTHYLFATEADLDRPGLEGAKWIFTPPPRTPADQQCLWTALAAGSLQLVSSDDASWPFEGQKKKESFAETPNGAPGIEERMTMVWQGVVRGHFDANRFVDLVAATPARLFGLFPRKGAVAVGADADLVIWDPEVQRVMRQSDLHHRVDYTLFEGIPVSGAPRTVLRRGEVLMEDGRYLDRPAGGRFIRRNRFGQAELGGETQ